MATEPASSKKIVSIMLAAAALGLGVLYVFRQEFADSFVESLLSNSTAVRRTVTDDELPAAPKMTLRPPANDIEFVKVSDLKAGPATSAGNSVSFTLRNMGDNNSFPSLEIILINRLGHPVRRVAYAPTDYPHPDKFETNEIQLMIPLQPGETGFTVKPLYQVAR